MCCALVWSPSLILRGPMSLFWDAATPLTSSCPSKPVNSICIHQGTWHCFPTPLIISCKIVYSFFVGSQTLPSCLAREQRHEVCCLFFSIHFWPWAPTGQNSCPLGPLHLQGDPLVIQEATLGLRMAFPSPYLCGFASQGSET